MFERLTGQKATLPQDDGLAKVGRTYTNESGEQRFASQAFVGNKSNDLASQMGQDKKQPYATIMSYFVNTKKSTGLRCISYTACLYSSSLRWKDSYISSGTL